MVENKDCPFCNVNLLYNNVLLTIPFWFVIDNNKPLTDGHIMLIPNRHIRSLEEMHFLEAIFYWIGLKWVFHYMKSKSKTGDAFSFVNAPSGQSVFHLHHHIVPNWFGIHGFDHLLRDSKKALDK